jgi:hypothetical protein
MAGIWEELFGRPWAAFRAGFEALSETASAEAAIARVAHGLALAPTGKDQAIVTAAAAPNSNLVVSSIPPGLEADAQVLPTVSEYLARGLDLQRWWYEVDPDWPGTKGVKQQFTLSRPFNRASRAYGFFDEAPVGGKTMPVMGNVQEMFYDQTRAPATLNRESTEWMRAQLEEFVMKYFMRISSFRPPDAFLDASQPTPPPALERLSWCPTPTEERVGFGFSQLFYKKVGSDSIDPFPSYERHAIVDQRDVGRIFEWLLLRVRIFDFAFTTKPFGERGPQLVFGLNEGSYLVVHEQFIRHRDRPSKGGGRLEPVADYGIGYAFIKSPTQSIFAYGPGEFDAAVEIINFRIYANGYISVRMVFVANRPTQTMNLEVDPVNWSFRLADVFSFGLASRVFAPAKDVLGRLPLRFRLDPVGLYLTGANLVSGGAATRTLCISMETLERLFLLQHFRQHYQTVLGSLETWRMIPDWTDTKNLPPWVISGLSA